MAVSWLASIGVLGSGLSNAISEIFVKLPDCYNSVGKLNSAQKTKLLEKAKEDKSETVA